MLLNCDNQCCEQMVAGSSSKSCHQRQNCSPNNGVDLANQASCPCHSSPEHNDQNCDTECQPISHNNQHNKGTKRRNESVERLPTVVLSSVSTNVAQQHQNNFQKADGSSAPQAASALMPESCTGDKWPTYPSPPPQEHSQVSHMDTSVTKTSESAGNDGGDEGCESCCDVEDYDYESILTKILNEKKLALSRSPDVINFFQQITHSKEPGVKIEGQDSQ